LDEKEHQDVRNLIEILGGSHLISKETAESKLKYEELFSKIINIL
jgi:hypothetical protein